MGHTTRTMDLLSLIGTSIEQLTRSIELFESASRVEGATCLSAVIRQIGAYVDQAQDDPLLQLAHIDAAGLANDLQQVKNDLIAVITQVQDCPSV